MRARYLRAAIAVLCGVSASAFAHASEVSVSSEGLGWHASPLHARELAQGRFEARAFERYVQSGDLAIYVGNVVYLRFPSALSSAELAEGVLKLGQAMGISRDGWHRREQEGAQVFETHWARQGRLVRIYSSTRAGQATYSIAVLRAAYADEALLEAELIQRKLARPEAIKVSARSLWLKALFASVPAFAQQNPCGGPCAPGNYNCLMQQSTCTQQQLLQQIDTLNKTGQTVTPILGSMNNQWGATNVQIGNANNNWAKTNQQFQVANQNWANSNKNWQQTNAQFARTNDLLEQFMDPGHAFLFAASTAAGAAVGVMAVNLAVDAIAAGGKAIIEAITGEQEEARILEKFEAALGMWEKTTKAAADLEQALDSLIALRELQKQYNVSRKVMMLRVGAEAAMQRSSLKKATGELDAATEGGLADCVKEKSELVAELEAKVAELDGLHETLQRDDNEASLCGRLSGSLIELRKMEGTLQNARAHILKGQGVWDRRFDKETEEADKAFRDTVANNAKWQKDAAAREDASYKKAMADIDEEKRQWILNCEKEEGGKAAEIPLIGGFRFGFRDKCKKRHFQERYEHEQQRRIDANVGFLRMKEAREKRGKELKDNEDGLWLNYQTQLGSKSAYLTWFTQIERDQKCLSDAKTCKPGEGAMLSRFEQLAKKGEKIQALCKSPPATLR